MVKSLLPKPAKLLAHCYNSKKEFVVILFCYVGNLFRHWRKKIVANNNNFFDEVLQKQFQPKTQKCGKFGPFLRIDQKTERFFSSRSGENPFLLLAKKIFDFIFAPLAEKIFCLLEQQKKQILQQLFLGLSRTFYTQSYNPFCTKAVLICVNSWNSFLQFESNLFSFW